MHSKKLKQALRLAIDTAGMRGPVCKRDPVEQVLKTAPEAYWALADIFEAKRAYLMAEATAIFNEPLSEAYLDKNVGWVPEEVRVLLADMPTFICIARRGGPNSHHVMTLKATRQNWEDYIALKKFIVGKTHKSLERDQDVLRFLNSTGSDTLEELLVRKKVA